MQCLVPVAEQRWDGRDVLEFALGDARCFLVRRHDPVDRHWLLRRALTFVNAAALPGERPASSLTRAGTATLIAIRRDGLIGIDMETRARIAHAATIDDRWLSPREREECRSARDPVAELTARWVLKEALGKALGVGLPIAPAAWSFPAIDPVLADGTVPKEARFALASHGDLTIGLALLPSAIRSHN